MKRMLMIGMALWLLLSLCASGVAAADPTVVLTDATGMPGETVAVTIRLDNNPGLISAKVRVSYDADALELVGCDVGGLPAHGYSTGKLENQPFVVNFCDGVAPHNYTAETFATLRFRIREDAVPDTYPLTMFCDFEGDFFNFDWDTVYFDLDQGSITVVPSATPVTPTTSSAATVTRPAATEAAPSATVSRPTAPVTTQGGTASDVTQGGAASDTETTRRPTPSTTAGRGNKRGPLAPAAMVIVIPVAVVVVAASIGVVAIIRKKKK